MLNIRYLLFIFSALLISTATWKVLAGEEQVQPHEFEEAATIHCQASQFFIDAWIYSNDLSRRIAEMRKFLGSADILSEASGKIDMPACIQLLQQSPLLKDLQWSCRLWIANRRSDASTKLSQCFEKNPEGASDAELGRRILQHPLRSEFDELIRATEIEKEARGYALDMAEEPEGKLYRPDELFYGAAVEKLYERLIAGSLKSKASATLEKFFSLGTSCKPSEVLIPEVCKPYDTF